MSIERIKMLERQETECIETSTGNEYKKIDCNGVIK